MSATPPDRKEAGDAPAGPRNPWVGWLGWGILSLVLYVLSTGPMVWLGHHHYLPEQVFYIYLPLEHLPDDFKQVLYYYVDWWRP